jgi:hypothetical protein
VAIEPRGGFEVGGHAAGEHDLERALAESHLDWCVVFHLIDSDAGRQQVVVPVAAPVEFFLAGNHQAA